MKRFKKITAVIMAVLMIVTVSGVSVVTTQAAVSGNFRYSVERDDGITYVEIERYLGKSSRVVIPSKIKGYKVREIAENAFKNNTKVKTIVIGTNVRDIDDSAFTGTKNLRKFEVKGNSKYKAISGVLVNKKTQYIEAFPSAKAKNYTVAKSIKGIGEGAFKGNKKIKKVVFRNVRVIEEEAFSGCSALTTVSFSGKLREVDEKAFFGCNKLKKVKLSKNVREIDDEAFGFKKYGKVSGFTIVGYYGSEAYEYARENGLKFRKA